LKPPFRLASGSSPARLYTDVDALAASLAPTRIDGLWIAPLGGFLALVPEGEVGAIAQIAAAAVAGGGRLATRRRAHAPPGSASGHLGLSLT